MAKKNEQQNNDSMAGFDFGTGNKFGQEKYPWTRIFSGNVERLVEGVDYDPATKGFMTRLRVKAKLKGLTLNIRKVTEGETCGEWTADFTGIVVQAIPKE